MSNFELPSCEIGNLPDLDFRLHSHLNIEYREQGGLNFYLTVPSILIPSLMASTLWCLFFKDVKIYSVV